jgi:hypothetical protein
MYAQSILFDIGYTWYNSEFESPKIQITPKGHYAVGKMLKTDEVLQTPKMYYYKRTAWDLIYSFGQSGKGSIDIKMHNVSYTSYNVFQLRLPLL